MEGIRSNLTHFGMLLKKKLNEIQVTAVNDRCHTESTEENEDVTNMAIAISAKDLFKQCVTKVKSQGIQKKQNHFYCGLDFNSDSKMLIPNRQ